MSRKFLEALKVRKQIFGLLLVITALMCCHQVFAQIVPTQTIRWQDFEYWDDPLNWGWKTSSYAYPYFGFGIGYGAMRTVLDFAEGSRVLEVWSTNPSVFNRLERFWVMNEDIRYLTPSGPQPITNHKVISFNVASRLGLEEWDQWEFQVGLITASGHYVILGYRPVGYQGEPPVLAEGGFPAGGNTEQNPAYVVVNLGRQYQDGTWHMVMRDMDEDIDLADNGRRDGSQVFGGGQSRIKWLRILGNGYRMDNIWFHTNRNIIANHPPKLQKIGPQFAQLFVPFNLLIEANDIDLLQPVPTGNPQLYFIATIGGWGAHGTNTPNLITRVKLVDDPTPIPFKGKFVMPCSIDDPQVESNLVMLTYVPQYLEDLIVTVRVTDRMGLSDVEVFPMSVVNYPVVNHPPRLEQLEDDFYLLGSSQPYEKYFSCYDQDYQKDIFGKSDKAGVGSASGNITFTAFIDGLPYYGYGPYQEDLIPEPTTPHIIFHPQFEGVHRIVVVARDTRGLTSIAEYTLVVANPGGWLNHPPVLGEDIDSPQVALAGQLFSIPVEFYDPDLEPLYYSCNIGMVTELPPEGIAKQLNADQSLSGQSTYGRYRNGVVYSFLTYFPGIYNVQITAYDPRGGWSTATFVLDVQPWWSL
ncbi:MAG: hypothetical protein K6U11_00125 [bacterium]|nr:hypothetical protein [bacterium]